MSRGDKARAKSIGHYILSKTIGEGTFGKVKLGTHILTGEKVAIKVLEKERIVDIADVERVAREIHILKLIRHPHIIQLYEIIETPRQLYLIMEYASGGELFDYIVAHTRVKENEACRFFHQILAGVEKIHEYLVVHRDLKPENLLLDDGNFIKIVDFGLSNTYPEGALLKTACGSPCYAAPEMVAGKHYIPSLCDIWSCGVILFALTCGFLPFEDQNTANLYKKILKGDYQEPDFLSPEAKDLIRGMLTTDPEQRVRIGTGSEPIGMTIRSHPWFKQCAPDCVLQPVWGDGGTNGPIDADVLQQLEKLGFPEEYVVKCLQMNKHNHATTTYCLLLEKKRRMQMKLGVVRPEKSEERTPRPDILAVPAAAKNPRAHHAAKGYTTSRPSYRDETRRPLAGTSLRTQGPPQSARDPPQTARDVEAWASPRRRSPTGYTTPRGQGVHTPTPNSARPRSVGGMRPSTVRCTTPTGRRPASTGTPGVVTPAAPQRRAVGTTPRQVPGRAGRSYTVAQREGAQTARAARSPAPAYGVAGPWSARGPGPERDLPRPASGEEMKTCRGAFNVSCTSSKNPREIMGEIITTLSMHGVSFKQVSQWSVKAQRQALRFEIGIAHLDDMDTIYVLRFKRVAGDLVQYKALCSTLLADMRL